MNNNNVIISAEKVVKNKYSLYDKFIFLLFSAYFILVPFYFWKSGIPQLSDWILVALIVIYMMKNRFKIRIPKESKRFLLVGLLFISYVVFSNLTWTMILNSSSSMMVTSSYYVYNYFVSVLIISLYSDYGQKILELTYKAVVLSILIQIIFFLINGGFTGRRMIGSFNNPNQLGYYALMTTSIIMYISSKINVRSDIFILSLISTFFLVIASLSSTAIVSYIGLVIFYLFSTINNKKFKRRIVIAIILILFIVTMVYETTNIIQESNMMRGLQIRMAGVDKKLDGFSSRGYYRITEYPQYWIFGAGEGEYIERFGFSIEFHSTLGNIQVSYGIIGTLLFISFMILAIKNDNYRSLYIIIFIMAYGLTHNGIRNSLLWILLSLISMGNIEINKLEKV